MFKKYLILSSVLSLSVAYAATQKPVYVRDGAEGEYPSAYDVVRDVKVIGAKTPGGARTTSCELQKGSTLYFAVIPSKTLTYQVGQFRALKDITITEPSYEENSVPKSANVKKGEIVKILTYYSEGFFRAKFSGGVEMDLEWNQVMGSNDFKNIQELVQESWAEVPCLDHSKIWINDAYLKWYPKSVKPGLYNPYEHP